MKGDIAKQAQHVGEALRAPIVIIVAVDRSRRLRELLREGKSAAQAIEIIQSELLEVSP